MRFRLLSAAALITVLLAVVATAPNAEAKGFHFRSGGVHVDVGNPHSSYGGYGHDGGYGHYPYNTYYGGGWGGHADWHDTTHLDYHPGEIVRHRGHYDYVPGHYDVHQEGHWDHHGF